MKTSVRIICSTIAILAFSGILLAQGTTVDTAPKFSGYIRSWYQSDFSTNQGQFLVKMARVNVGGNVNEFASYKFMVDAAPLSKFSTTTTTINGTKVLTGASSTFSDILLDAQATIAPVKDLSFSMGQFKVPFSTDNLRGGASIDFVNRPLLTNVAPALRDIGFMGSYKIKGSTPIDVSAGLFNGTGQNKAEGDRSSNYVSRVNVGIIKGLNAAANYYGGTNAGSDLSIVDLGVDWAVDQFFVDGEYAMRDSKTLGTTLSSSSYFAYVLYNLQFVDSEIKSIVPAVRYESFDPNTSVSSNEVGRITLGVAVEFAKVSYAQFRINYEKYDYKNGTPNPNKLIFEVQTRF
jgi:hypothetical protein